MDITWFYDSMRHYYGGVFDVESPSGGWFGVLIDDDDEFRFVGVSGLFVPPYKVEDSLSIKRAKNKTLVRRLERLVAENKAEITKRLLRNQDDTGKLSYYQQLKK